MPLTQVALPLRILIISKYSTYANINHGNFYVIEWKPRPIKGNCATYREKKIILIGLQKLPQKIENSKFLMALYQKVMSILNLKVRTYLLT